jgi:hypothetical protein
LDLSPAFRAHAAMPSSLIARWMPNRPASRSAWAAKKNSTTGDQVLLDRIGMNPVVDLGEVAPDIPAELLSLLLLESLEFLDEIEFEFNGNPGCEFKGDVRVGVSPPITSLRGHDADGVRFDDPLLRGQDKAVESGLLSKPLEFEGFEIGVVQLLPYPQKLHRTTVSQPVGNEEISILGCQHGC